MSAPLKLVLLAIIVAMAVGLAVFTKRTRSKTEEARRNVKVIYDAARANYMFHSNPKEFPRRSVGPTPPAGSCCQFPDGKCPPNPELWQDPGWQALNFSVPYAHYYSYEYILAGPASIGPFTARALGDLDCDGEFSTFEMYGTINSLYAD